MLAYVRPCCGGLLAWRLLGERPTGRHVLGFACAGAGLLAIIAPWQGMGSLAGSVLALLGGVSWGLGTVLSKIMFQRHAPNVLNLTMWQMALGALLSFLVTLVLPQQEIGRAHV